MVYKFRNNERIRYKGQWRRINDHIVKLVNRGSHKEIKPVREQQLRGIGWHRSPAYQHQIFDFRCLYDLLKSIHTREERTQAYGITAFKIFKNLRPPHVRTNDKC